MVVDGVYYALAFSAGALAVSLLAGPLFGLPLLAPAFFCAWFFRDPERTPPPGDIVVSPADGKVTAVRPEAGSTRVSIFMNVFDVHVNRAPISGTIEHVKYTRGSFKPAQRDECGDVNEQNLVVIRGEGTEVAFKQIAGLIARRIVFHKRAGDRVRAGERVGLIKFGSRVDVMLGPEWRIVTAEGRRVRAGESVIARRGVTE